MSRDTSRGVSVSVSGATCVSTGTSGLPSTSGSWSLSSGSGGGGGGGGKICSLTASSRDMTRTPGNLDLRRSWGRDREL